MLSLTNNENSAYHTQLTRSSKVGASNKKKGLNVVDINAIMPEVYTGEPKENGIDYSPHDCEMETYLPPSEDGNFWLHVDAVDYSDALITDGYVEDLFEDVSALSQVWRPRGASVSHNDGVHSCEGLLLDELPPMLLRII
ncbi:hypothetical protein ECG_04637 [Echinococcus granulosus]|nr:hypothetical protein ECG_04637 [Echinococcus granulosus]